MKYIAAALLVASAVLPYRVARSQADPTAQIALALRQAEELKVSSDHAELDAVEALAELARQFPRYAEEVGSTATFALLDAEVMENSEAPTGPVIEGYFRLKAGAASADHPRLAEIWKDVTDRGEAYFTALEEAQRRKRQVETVESLLWQELAKRGRIR